MMSIEKEVEKMYREDSELRKKAQKRKKNSRIATVVMLVLIAVVAVLLAEVLGLIGKDEDQGGVIMNGSSSADSSVSMAEQSADSDNERKFEHIKVSGSTYLYKGSEVKLDELAIIFNTQRMDKDVVAVIEDDNATEETMADLTKLFENMGRGYMLVSSVSTETAQDSSTPETVTEKDRLRT